MNTDICHGNSLIVSAGGVISEAARAGPPRPRAVEPGCQRPSPPLGVTSEKASAIRRERRTELHDAFVSLTCGLIRWRRLNEPAASSCYEFQPPGRAETALLGVQDLIPVVLLDVAAGGLK
ncbi:hypothetical protein [Streptomyces sp. CB00455]|uniref:hypothetical protein n=1 Tax=Streptomyces sp. CB00455 TaxID=1703927 RepID=UPI0011614455|nr:hypothetical protein [Streptomyces sp. CB00455]